MPSGDAELPCVAQEGAVSLRRRTRGAGEAQPGVPLRTKLCYALGGIPYQMTGNVLGFFLQIFLLDVVQLKPFHASLILFLGRAWDAITDPAVGFLVSKSPRRKYGKLMPWIAGSTPLGVLCYCMMWAPFPGTTSDPLKFLWYLFTYSCFQTCMTVRTRLPGLPAALGTSSLGCYHVPYSSLTMFLGGTQRDRDSATAYRMGMEVFSTLLGSGIQGQLVGSYHARMANSCYVPNGTVANGSSAGLAASLDTTHRAYVAASLVLGSIYLLSCLILVFGVREQPGPLSPLGKVGLSLGSCLRMIVEHKPYVQLLCGFLCASLAFQIAQGIFATFCTHAAGLAGKFQHLVLIMLVTAALSIPFWQWLLGRLGKKTAVSLGLLLIIPALVAITQVMHNFLAFIFLMMVAGCSMAVLYLLPWSMLPDAVDDFRLRNPGATNLEALFYSFYVFFNKFAGGLAVGISTLTLHFAGYRAGDCTHKPSVVLALRLLMAPVPIGLLLLAVIIFCTYPIDEERRKEMRREMEAIGHQDEHSGME
ncbi:sodium-dependent lysophosphatidylcholine symporter 1-A-like [Nothoprocta perdicaria]|uniref:sodium-dependent lysophosphatidylcholine symporter 1-A-like n=1 Tax=Nothoprocta perdicaria TaxID=30464 RepID=UPI000E1BFB0D|nr:sodium-dependent lysophosphatidylcholine symporter 1-A-like [Nothoprocta perdicaria]